MHDTLVLTNEFSDECEYKQLKAIATDYIIDVKNN